jgi:glycosyltransferase involved in cell wall biosynthesis
MPEGTEAVRDPERVVVVTSFDWPKPGGLERVMEVEVKELLRRGIAVDVVASRSPEPEPDYLEGKGTLHRRPYRYVSFVPGFVMGLFFAFSARRTLRRLGRKPGTVVHAHNTYAAFAAILAGLRRRTLLHLHSVSSQDKATSEAAGLSLPVRVLNRLDTWFCLAFEHLIYNAMPRVVAVSEQEHDDAKRKMRHPERLGMLRNGVDTEVFRPDPNVRADVRKRLGIPEDKVVVLMLGRFVPKNGTLLIAQAVPKANKLGTADALYVFVGAGTEEPFMREVFAREGVTNFLILPPQSSPPMYAMADVFVSHVTSSLDGHGLTILEAMATGVATISGADRIKGKVFDGTRDLMLIPKDSADAIAEAFVTLVKDAPLRRAMGERAREKVTRDLSIRVQVDGILARLHEVGR